MTETEGYAPTFHTLLPHAHGHLRDVDERPLGSSNDHLLHVIILLQILLRVLPRSVTCQVELSLDTALEGFAKGHARSRLQTVMVSVLDDGNYVLLALGYVLSDVCHGFLICDSVTDTDTEAVMEEPEVDNHLDTSEKLTSC